MLAPRSYQHSLTRRLPLLLLLLLLLLSLLQAVSVTSSSSSSSRYNSCCEFPCKNGGLCLDASDGSYECDCTGTGYYGNECHKPRLATRIALLLRPDPETSHWLVTNFRPIWSLVNRFSFLRRLVMRLVLRVRLGLVPQPAVFAAGSAYTTANAFANHSYYVQTLPPVPRDCPTQMGTKGPKKLPSINEVVGVLFRRIDGKFKPNEIGTNMLFSSFAQHFSHMFFKSDPRQPSYLTWGDHNIYMSHLYGKNSDVESRLRQWRGGRLRSQMINGEEYPEFTSKVPMPLTLNPLNLSQQFAVGHQIANMLPTAALWQTLYLRDHNRVAERLARLHPHWDDEQLFQTAKLILIGKTLKIVVEDYVQHLSNYQFKLLFDPTILHAESVQYQNRIAIEFNLLYHWHPLMPDAFTISGTRYNLQEVFFNGTQLLQHPSRDYVAGLVNSVAGSFSANNHPEVTLVAARAAVKVARQMRLQSLNNYRRRFRLKPYATFQELTGGDEDLACSLRSLYKDIDAVEFYSGLVVEHHRPHAMFGSSMIEIGSPYSLQGIFGNAIASRHLWRPATFGGEEGFQMVRSASLRQFVCDNVPGPCPEVSFSVPPSVDKTNSWLQQQQQQQQQEHQQQHQQQQMRESRAVAMPTNTNSNCATCSGNDEL